MRLLIIGATGGTGLQVTSQAVEGGHRVTAFVRSPQKLGSLRHRVVVREGDPRSVADLRAMLPGHDAVISTLGPQEWDPQRSSAPPPEARSPRCKRRAYGDCSSSPLRCCSTNRPLRRGEGALAGSQRLRPRCRWRHEGLVTHVQC